MPSGGASQPAIALQELKHLNKSSAKIATFGVRLWGGRAAQYQYKRRPDNLLVTQHKFEVWLVGLNPEAYCSGYVKGTETAGN